MRRFISSTLVFLALLPVLPARAQLAPGATGFEAPFGRTTENPLGYRLDGNAAKQALIRTPELEIKAGAIAFDGRTLESLTEVRALGNVNLQITPQSKGGPEQAIQIQSKSDEAKYTRATQTLVLQGNLSGFYRIGNGPQTMLSGNKATFKFSAQGVNALIESGDKSQVELLLPAEKGKADALGPVTVRADSLRLDQSNNAAYFTGNARAFSNGGTNKLDVSAPAFTLLRAADGTIGTLTTNGRTTAKMDVAPDVATPTATPKANALTYVEITGDKAVVNRATSTGVFDGNVTGFYRLQDAPKPFNIKGEQVTVKFDPLAAKTGDGLSVVATGTPVSVEVPAFTLGF